MDRPASMDYSNYTTASNCIDALNSADDLNCADALNCAGDLNCADNVASIIYPRLLNNLTNFSLKKIAISK